MRVRTSHRKRCLMDDDLNPYRSRKIPGFAAPLEQGGGAIERGSRMTDNAPQTAPKPKKSVALSGVAAGNTAVCTVGRSGNDLHYRGYDIADLAANASFEEVAHLLVHGSLPSFSQLRRYRQKLQALRGLPAIVPVELEQVHAAAPPQADLRAG